MHRGETWILLMLWSSWKVLEEHSRILQINRKGVDIDLFTDDDDIQYFGTLVAQGVGFWALVRFVTII